jgi:exopolysaccharide production protein ExoZ
LRSAEHASASASTIDTRLPSASPVHQIDGLQILRAVAVLLVAWIHSGQAIEHDGGRALPGLGVYGVDIFFVISGFIISSVVLRSRKPAGTAAAWDFLKRRLLRIFPIYWFFGLLCIARLLLSHQFSAEDHLPALLLLPSLHYPKFAYLLSYSWTLIFEMFFYYAISCILLFTVRWAIPTSIALFTAAILLGAVIGIRHPILNVVCNPMLFEFVFGAVIALLHARLGRRRPQGILFLLLGTIAALYLHFAGPTVANGSQMILTNSLVSARVFTWGLSAALVVGGMIFWAPSTKSTAAKLAVVLGNASYSTYLASVLALKVAYRLLRFVLHHVPTHSLAQVAFTQIFCVIAIFCVGWLSYRLVELPMLRALSKRLIAPSRPNAKAAEVPPHAATQAASAP